MSEQKNSNKEQKGKGAKEKENIPFDERVETLEIKVPSFVAKKIGKKFPNPTKRTKECEITADMVLVYQWLYTMNTRIAEKEGDGYVFGKKSKDELAEWVRKTFGFPARGDYFDKMVWAGLLKMVTFKFKGERMVGYRCMLGKKAKNVDTAESQKAHQSDEENVIEVDSAVQRVETEEQSNLIETWVYGGQYYYIDDNGEKHIITEKAAKNPPPKGYVYDDERECWCKPEELTRRKLDF